MYHCIESFMVAVCHSKFSSILNTRVPLQERDIIMDTGIYIEYGFHPQRGELQTLRHDKIPTACFRVYKINKLHSRSCIILRQNQCVPFIFSFHICTLLVILSQFCCAVLTYINTENFFICLSYIFCNLFYFVCIWF